MIVLSGVILLIIVIIAYIFNYWWSGVGFTRQAEMPPINLVAENIIPVPDSGEKIPEAAASTTAAWLTYADGAHGFSFKYPPQLTAKYITPQVWPPQISFSDGHLICPVTPATGSQAERISRERIGQREYCLDAQSEGAAGSVYTDYSYKTELGGRLVAVNFTLRYPQCYNYDNPQQAECVNERQIFNLTDLIDKIVGTIHPL